MGQLKRRKYLFGLMVSDGSVHHGGEGMAEQLTSWWTGSTAERQERARHKTLKTPVACFFLLGLTS
jgi:hypothetical protein